MSMQGWTMPVRDACFNGVPFQVFSVEDNFERALIEHSYPFVNGADLESMGLNPLTVNMSAVFFGDGYYTDFKKFIDGLKINKPSVLVHPIRGRLQNMFCVSASLSHDAENINYVTAQLSFREATTIKPIFLFENSLLSSIDTMFSRVDSLLNNVIDLYGFYMERVAFVFNAKSKLLSTWNALIGVFNGVSTLIADNKTQFKSISPSVSKTTLKKQAIQALSELNKMVKIALNGVTLQGSIVIRNNGMTTLSVQDNRRVNGEVNAGSLSDLTMIFNVRNQIDEVLRMMEKIVSIPRNVVSGKNEQPRTPNQVLVDGQEKQGKSRVATLTLDDIKEIDCALRLLCSAHLVNIAVDLIERHSDNLVPSDIDYVVTKVRLNLLSNLNMVRELQVKEQKSQLTVPNTAIYTSSQQTAESVRNLGHQFTQLCQQAINQKPPLIIRLAEISGTIQQVAHHFYGDYHRAEELLRLNPQIRYPNFINQNEVLKSYAK